MFICLKVQPCSFVKKLFMVIHMNSYNLLNTENILILSRDISIYDPIFVTHIKLSS